MSGGAYEYLYLQDAEDLTTYRYLKQLQDMADRLAGLGYAGDAANETQHALLSIRQCFSRPGAIHERMQDIWSAVEGWDSGGCGEDAVRHALAQYRRAISW